MRDPKRAMCATILVLEAVVLGLTAPVMIAVADVATTTALLVGLGLALAAFLAAGMLGRPGGYALGTAVQVAAVALGLVVTVMFVLGAVFGGLWALALSLGRRIESDRAAAGA